MPNVTRRNMLSLTAGAAVAASTGAALALPASSALDCLIATYAAAVTDYERALHALAEKETAFHDWKDALPDSDRYFETMAFAPVQFGKLEALKIDMTKGLAAGLERIDGQVSHFATGFVCLEPAQSPEFQAAYDHYISERPAHIAKLEAIKAEVRPAFTAACQRFEMQAARLDYSQAEQTELATCQAWAAARLAVLAYRPVNGAERETKGAWLHSEYGHGFDALDEKEAAALLASLYPVNA